MINTSCGNTFGDRFRVTTFGESHGEALGAVVDGAPSGIPIDITYIQKMIDKRKPNTAAGGTARAESDKVEVLSGVFNGVTTGTPIALLIKNTTQNSRDYGNLIDTFRPGHADMTYDAKFGVRDYRGGGRSSGRETVARVAAGAVAHLVLKKLLPTVKIYAYTLSAAGVSCKNIDYNEIDNNIMRAPDSVAAKDMVTAIGKLREAGDSAGGVVECTIKGAPAGLGNPVFDKFSAVMAHAMFSIGAVKGVEFGAGFACANNTGSKNNDAMKSGNDHVEFLSNNAGGVLGGITNGDDIIFRVAIKAVPSIYREQKTVKKIDKGHFSDTTLTIKGRHDVCLCPRIAPVVDAMAAIVLCDFIL